MHTLLLFKFKDKNLESAIKKYEKLKTETINALTKAFKTPQSKKPTQIIVAFVTLTQVLSDAITLLDSNASLEKYNDALQVVLYKLSNNIEYFANINNLEKATAVEQLISQLRNYKYEIDWEILFKKMVTMLGLAEINFDSSTITETTHMVNVTDRIIFRRLEENPSADLQAQINSLPEQIRELFNIFRSNTKWFIENKNLIYLVEFIYLIAIQNLILQKSSDDLIAIIDGVLDKKYKDDNILEGFLNNLKDCIKRIGWEVNQPNALLWRQIMSTLIDEYRTYVDLPKITTKKLWAQTILERGI